MDPQLTTKCFTFTQSLIHKPPFETCRAAKRRQVQVPVQKKIEEEQLLIKFPRRGKRNIKAPRKLADEEDPPPRKRSAAKSQVLAKKEVKLSEDELAGRCSLNCTGQEGVFPSVHCQRCLCLFHPQCIGLKRNDKAKQAVFECAAKECEAKPESTDNHSALTTRKSKEKARKVIQLFAEKKTRMRMPGRRDFAKGRGGRSSSGHGKVLADPVSDEKTNLPNITEDEVLTQTQNTMSILKPLPPLVKAPDLEFLNTSAETEVKKYTCSGAMSAKLPALKASPGVQLLPKRVPVEIRPAVSPKMEYLIVASPNQSQAAVPTGLCSNVAFSQIVQMGSLVPSVGTSVNGVIIRMPSPATPNLIPSPASTSTVVPPVSSSAVQLMIGRGMAPPVTVAGTSLMAIGKDVQPVQNRAPAPLLGNSSTVTKHQKTIRRVFSVRHHDGLKRKYNFSGKPQSAVAVLAKVTGNGDASCNIRRRGTSMLRRVQTTGPSCTDGESSDDSKLRLGRNPRIHPYSLRNRKSPMPILCHINRLHAGLDGLLKIFSYLNVGDLLRASRVCRTWHTAASFPTLWKTMTLRGTKVYDWDGFAKVVRRFDSARLDLRGMQHFEDRNRTWHGFSSILENMQQVKRIDFGEVPSSVVHTVANVLQNLEVLVAEEITDANGEKDSESGSNPCRLDIGKLGQMHKLSTLRIKGLNGINLPTFCLSGGMTNLEALTNLTHLSLTSLKDVTNGEFGFLSALTNLTTLELGDCNGWQQETFATIGHLENLKRLRLEMTTSSNLDQDYSLDAALRPLHRLVQLELVLFPIPSWFCVTLETLKSLKELVFWTDTENEGAARNNSNIVKAVETARTLKQMTWGIVLPKSMFERPSAMELDQFSKCIPFDKETTFSSGDGGDGHGDISATGQRMVCPNALMVLMRTVLPTTEVRVVVSPLVTAFPACCKFR